jgi:uncharacterized membrane protein
VSTDAFETFLGLPLHPLVIHAAVVFVPLLILVGISYALIPKLRSRLDLVAAVLAIIAPLSTFGAKLSGDAFERRLRIEAPGSSFDKIAEHSHFGTYTLYVTILLGVLVLAMVLNRRKSMWWHGLLSVLVIAAGAAAGYYVFRTGDTAAHIVWGHL